MQLLDVEREDGILIPVEGESVSAVRFHPTSTTEPLPVVLTYTPYHIDDFATYGSDESFFRYIANAGYNVIVADLVGTGASSGLKREPDTMEEGTEAATIVEWLADRAWTTGAVGMIGKSYAATTSLKAAMEGPEPLRAIVPIHGPHTGYRDAHEGGSFAFYRMGADWAPYMHALAAKPPSRRDRNGRWADVWWNRLDALTDAEPWLFQYLDHQTKDAYWADKDVPLNTLDVPTLAVCGWRDAYTTSTLEYFEATDAPKQLILGPWGHEMPHTASEKPIDFGSRVIEWFDHFLKNASNGALEHPKRTIWTSRGHKPGRGEWNRIGGWSSLATDGISLALTPNGLESADAFTGDGLETTYEYDHTVGMHSIDGVYVSGSRLDTNPDDVRSLTFTTPPLTAPREVTGTGTAQLRVSATTADPMIVVRVVDVAPDGSATLVTHGELQASRRGGESASDPLQVGETYELSIPLKPTSHIFEVDHEIRVAVSNAYFPLNYPEREQGSMTVTSTPDEPSVVFLPGGTASQSRLDRKSIEMARSDWSGENIWLGRRPHTSWETARDHTNGSARVTISNTDDLVLPHANVRSSIETTCRSLEREPLSATADANIDFELAYDDETVHVETSSQVRRDSARIQTRILIDDRLVFDEQWWR